MLFMVVPLIGALDSLDDSLIEAAYDLGGSGPSILRRIVIPHAAPGIVAGCIVVFMLTLGNYLTPTLLGGKNSLWFTEQIYTQFITRFNWEQGAAFGFLLLGLSTADRLARAKLTGQRFGDVMRRHMIPSLPRPRLAARRHRGLRAGCSSPSCSCRWWWWRCSRSTTRRYPAPPWRGFTLDWFVGARRGGRVGLFADAPLLGSLWTSVVVAGWVTLLSVVVGTANAFLIERAQFRGKAALSLLMLAPLVIPGVILGISILAFASRIAQLADDLLGLELDFLRPGLPLVVLGQFSYIVSIATLTIAARLQALRHHAGGGGLQPGRLARRGARHHHAALPAAGADRRGRDLVPDVVRELQHHADAGRLRPAADRDDVRPHARGREPGAQRGEPVPDGRPRRCWRWR